MNKYLEKIGDAKLMALKGIGAGIGALGAGYVAVKGVEHSIKKEQEDQQKQAGVQDWVDDLLGGKAKKTSNIMEGMRHAASSGKSYGQYEKELGALRNATAKARIQAGAGVAGVAAAGLYGLHRYKENKREQILQSYQNLYKQATIASALGEIVKRTASGTLKGVKNVARATGDTLNTAGGGKVKTFANKNGIAHGSKEMKDFNNAKTSDRLKMLKGKLGKPGSPRKDSSAPKSDRANASENLRKDFKRLTRDQTNARIVAGAVPTAGYIGYKKGKKKGSEQQQQQVYY